MHNNNIPERIREKNSIIRIKPAYRGILYTSL